MATILRRSSASPRRSLSSALRSYLFSLFLAKALAQSPIRIQYDAGTTGPDGPWHTLNQSVGVFGDFMPMLPSLGNTTMVVSASACADAWEEVPCPSPQQPLWQATEAYRGSGLESGLLHSEEWDPSMSHFGGMFGDAVFMPQTLTLYDYDYGEGGDGVSGPFVVRAPEHAVTRSENLTMNYPGGAGYTLNTGFFSLNGYNNDLSWTASSDGTTKTRKRTLIEAYERGYIPSISYGLHVGSPSLNIPGSLILGGYDSSRFLSDPITIQSSSLDGVELLDISLNVRGKQSAYLNFPNNSSSQSNLLRDANNASAPLNVRPDPGLPYLYLTKPTCDALARHLPITYNEELNLYLWDTSSPAHTQLLTSLHYVTFTFSTNAGTPSSVNLPLALLNLSLIPPLVDTPTPYFPCSHWDPQTEGRAATLGRAFLQGASLGANWGQSISWLSQAPGPGFAAEKVRSIAGDTTRLEIDSGLAGWEESWAGTLSALDDEDDSSEDGGDNSSPEPSKHGDEKLSTGATAGIVVAVVVVVLAVLGLVLWRFLRRRRARTGAAGSGLMASGEPQVYNEPYHVVQGRDPVEKYGESVVCEADGAAEVAEMGDERGERVELPDYEVRELEAEVPGVRGRGTGGWGRW